MASKKVLNIISEHYPYGTGEQFFDAEVNTLASYYDEIQLFPLIRKGELRKLPDNVKVNNVLSDMPRVVSKSATFRDISLILKIVFFEWRKSDKRAYILKKMKRWLVSISQAASFGEEFLKEIDQNKENQFYSFWMNDGALTLSILKDKGKIDSFNFRVNGFDIFNERHEAGYMPFRFYNYKHVRKVFVLSSEALNYLKGLNCFPNKLVLSHYGIYENPTNRLTGTETIRIVSVANVIPLKRIDKIISALSYLEDLKISWTHFGDGFLMEELKAKASELSDNIIAEFKGNVPNGEIINTYNSEPVNLFIHTSETEGLGMAIIEAQSFGIPAVVIGVGGVLDIVSDETGAVLHPQAEGEEIAAAIRDVLESEKNSNAYREVIKKNIYKKFGAAPNYKALFEALNVD
ncbi:MAG: glycosyltransferase [Crocinitomicaceae bacterium]